MQTTESVHGTSLQKNTFWPKSNLLRSIYVLTTQMSEGTLRTLVCHCGQANKDRGPSYSRLRRQREGEVTVHCARPSASAPADRPQESQSPWRTGICWAPSPIAGLSPFRTSEWPRKAERRRSWGEVGTRAAVTRFGSLLTVLAHKVSGLKMLGFLILWYH